MNSSDRTQVKRHPERGVYDADVINAILDEALACTVSISTDDGPIGIPMIHARIDSTLYLHGANLSRMLTTLETGPQVCVTATLVDGIVLARTVFHSSLNYRSVVIIGQPRPVSAEDEKVAAMKAVTEHIVPGRWEEVRKPSPKEIAGTKIVAIEISEASAKVRTGPPIDEAEDSPDVWSGVIPLRTVALDAIAVRKELDTPRSVTTFVPRR